jgi:hypothetical protein
MPSSKPRNLSTATCCEKICEIEKRKEGKNNSSSSSENPFRQVQIEYDKMGEVVESNTVSQAYFALQETLHTF